MNFYPKIYLNSVIEITSALLAKYNIKGLLLDVDNTLIDYDKKILQGTEEWVKEMKAQNIKLGILSNTNQKQKVETLAKTLQIPYIYFANKPLKKAFRKGKEMLQLENEQIGVVGDQIFTDVVGANRSNMVSILVKPINEKDIFITKLKRPFEEKIIKKYKEQVNKQEIKQK